ncbi:helix-turn-helix transcriptional regulator [Streptomyces sp. NPDC051976]|uniref:helix-turn-helix domain-containing protein n=1 Tax=Streptomyces sp. NPDC051976 TaxID=3154947 RepID=UPI00344835C5
MASKDEGSPSMRMFGSVVRSLREARGLSTDEVAAHAGYSRSLTVKIERGERMPPPLFVDKAEDLFGSGEVLAKAAAHLDRGNFPSWFEPYAELEKSAISLYTYDTLLINGLLQTEEYARAVFTAYRPMLDSDEVERRVQARMARQELLNRTPAAQLGFILEEWVVHRLMGEPDLRRRQAARLLEVGAQRNVTIQVMPMSFKAHAGVDGPMTVLETPSRELLAYLEVQGRGLLVDERDEVSVLNQRYAMIRSQALNVGDSARLIEQMAGEQ